MKPLARLFLVAVLMLSIGLHWNVLQVVAWVNMLQTYTAQQGIIQGAIMTFDAEHPCSMCKKIATSKDHDQTKTSGKTDKLDASSKWISDSSLIKVISDSWRNSVPVFGILSSEWLTSQWINTPPTPPPRRSEG